MMGWAGAVVLIVLIVTIGKVMSRRYAALARYGDAEAESTASRASADEVRHLRERIAVLERVITDNHGSHQLDREIERLRDR